MDTTVYVVGTLHRYQGTYNIGVGATATKEELEQFKRFLKEIVCQHRIRSVAEEMSVEALRKYPHPNLPSGESIPFQVAEDLNLPHRYCDRDLPEDERELHWLQQLENFNSFPCLFVVGSDHADSFPALLNKSRLRPSLLINEWKPITSWAAKPERPPEEYSKITRNRRY
jgi:hypothetical protein